MTSYIRKAHVVRITDPGTGSWVDVLRLDYFGSVRNAGAQGLGHALKWQDDSGDGTGQSANPTRRMENITVNDADGNRLVDVPAIKAMTAYNSGQRSTYHFNNDREQNTLRNVVKVNVHPVDIGSVDPTVPMDWEDYKAALLAGTVDTSSSLPTAIPLAWKTKQQQGFDYQGVTHRLGQNSRLQDELVNLETTTDDGAWLDPFQVIVNWDGNAPPYPYVAGIYGSVTAVAQVAPGQGPGGATLSDNQFAFLAIVGSTGFGVWTMPLTGPDAGVISFGSTDLTGITVNGLSGVPNGWNFGTSGSVAPDSSLTFGGFTNVLNYTGSYSFENTILEKPAGETSYAAVGTGTVSLAGATLDDGSGNTFEPITIGTNNGSGFGHPMLFINRAVFPDYEP